MKDKSLWDDIKTKEDVLLAIKVEGTTFSHKFGDFVKSSKMEELFPEHHKILRNALVKSESAFEAILDSLLSENPKMDDVIGYETLASKIREEMDFGSRTFLFYGPPGNGKSFLARAVASSFSTVVYLPVSTFMDSFSSRHTSAFFESLSSDNVSVVVDEFDFIERCGAERVKATFLRAMESKSMNNLRIFLTSSEPWRIDYMFFRKGRIDHSLYFHPPGLEMREKILRKYGVDERIADRTMSYSVSEMVFVANRVSRGVPFENLNVVPAYHEWKKRMRYCDPAQLCLMLPELKREFDGAY